MQDAPDPTIAYAGPLAVLVDRFSASASEIFAGAIQDYRRGVVLGQRTFGKGTVQNLVPLDRWSAKPTSGQLTVTIGKFYRVTGGSTQNKGVVPDIKLVDIYNEEFGERKAKNALEWDTIPTAPFKREGSVQPYVQNLAQLSQQRVVNDPQFKYLEQRKAIAKKTDEQKRVVLDIDQRKAELNALEQQTLESENQRRIVTGQKPYANWESYQASIDALIESRAKMKAAKRPALAEEEVFVTESAQVLLDYAKLQSTKASAK